MALTGTVALTSKPPNNSMQLTALRAAADAERYKGASKMETTWVDGFGRSRWGL
jgi:hypothetical protein